MMEERFWQMGMEKLQRALTTDLEKGLSSEEAARRREEYGPNQLKEKKGAGPLALFFGQFNDFIVWVLIGAALVSGFLREWVDAGAIIVIVILNTILGFIQEYRAEQSLAALKKLSSPLSKTRRDGVPRIIPSSELVPGDVIELESGDKVPADARLTYLTPNFTVQEASLTGESVPVAKTAAALAEADVPLADRANMVYLGTSVSSGKARAVIAETGMQTELGRIAGMIQETSRQTTPLQRKLEEFGRVIVYACFAVVVVVFVMGILRGGGLLDVFLLSVSLAVAAIPEGLPAVVTIALALGVQRMVKRHVLIRKLPSVETLGCATVICTDKTGTLTKNEMTVRNIFAGGELFSVTGAGYAPEGAFFRHAEPFRPEEGTVLHRALACAVLCNGARLMKTPKGYEIAGDPTEGALLTAAAKVGILQDDLECRYPFVEELPFDSVRKKMTIVRRDGDGWLVFTKGAPDVLLDDCVCAETEKGCLPLSGDIRTAIEQANESLADAAMRNIALAGKRIDERPVNGWKAEELETGLTFLGLAAMIDPPREEVKAAVRECRNAGIRAVMITGDHKNTAVAIAKELGLYGEDSLALTGAELDGLDESSLDARLARVSVYARVSPEHKLRIVKAWRRRKEIVAMTGDGVNDAPAVREADIGVAMGITGTDVTKEVSDMVITDDNFASLVGAVEEGRGIYDNIRKFIHYLLSCNTGEILTIFIPSLFGLATPLLPIHILWINLVTDGLPALALGMDPVDPTLMGRPPRPRNEPVISRSRGLLMFWQGLFIAFCSLAAFFFVLKVEEGGTPERARTAAFVVLAASQIVHSFNCRSMTESLFKLGIRTNMKLVYAGLVSFLLLFVVASVPFFQVIFKTESLSAFDWMLVVSVSLFPLGAMEVVKWVGRLSRP